MTTETYPEHVARRLLESIARGAGDKPSTPVPSEKPKMTDECFRNLRRRDGGLADGPF